MPLEAIRAIAGAVPKEAVVFVDEAYAEFSGATFIPHLPSFPNVVVGRTFSKAFGLAGLRIGCLIGAVERLDPVRLVIPVYSVNVAAAVALPAALEDRPFVEEYLRQVAESKELLYAACDRLGLTYWRSAANFVLVCAGERVTALVKGAADRGIYIRDRSAEPGCAGCVRIGTGAVAHTRRCIDVMDEVLCVAD
jgi:histidinol-phosphate aminotransferase